MSTDHTTPTDVVVIRDKTSLVTTPIKPDTTHMSTCSKIACGEGAPTLVQPVHAGAHEVEDLHIDGLHEVRVVASQSIDGPVQSDHEAIQLDSTTDDLTAVF